MYWYTALLGPGPGRKMASLLFRNPEYMYSAVFGA
jgi:hypothetical protein